MKTIDPACVWVICPAFNEASSLPRVLGELNKYAYNIVVVDDGSSDSTRQIATTRASAVITHPINLGQGAALKTGFNYALAHGARFIVTFDSDGQHRVSDIPQLLATLEIEHADFALGSRFLKRTSHRPPLMRRLLLRAATWFTTITTGLHLTDTHNGLRAFTRRGAIAIRLRQNRMAHASEILAQIAQSGLHYVEVPVTIDYTGYSLAKGQRTSDFIMILLDLFTQKLYR